MLRESSAVDAPVSTRTGTCRNHDALTPHGLRQMRYMLLSIVLIALARVLTAS